MNKKLLIAFIIMALMQGACSFGTFNPNIVIGSGKLVRETRSVSGFSSVDLQGSAKVVVTFGAPESVIVEADDNILPLIETKVNNGQLIISTRSNTSINTTHPVHVSVTMQALKRLTLSGSGTIDVSKMAGDSLTVALPGSGNISVTGTATNVNISLPGSGNVLCGGLQAQAATVKLNGSGNVEVFANQSLDASIMGSGTIHYGGNPARVNKNIIGSGSITPEQE